jgi:SAM-dependent methyltransferase
MSAEIHSQYDALGKYYDLAYGSTAPAADQDVKFYLRLAKESGSAVLEMGSGSGRVCIQLAAAGVKTVGIEFSRSMLVLARRKARGSLTPKQRRFLTLIQKDMCEVTRPEKVGMVIYPYSALLEVGSLDRVREALARGYEALANDGIMVVDCFFYGPGSSPRPDGVLREGRIRELRDGKRVQFYETDFRDHTTSTTKRWLFADTYDKHGLVIERRFWTIHRVYVAPREMRGLLRDVGFRARSISLYGSFDGKSRLDNPGFQDRNSPMYQRARQVWLCRKGGP